MNQDLEILKFLAKKDKEIEKLYNKLIYQLSKVSLNVTKINNGAFFSFDDYPEIKKKVDAVLDSYSKEQQQMILDGIRTSMKISFATNAAVLSQFTRYSDKGLREMRENAAEAFISSRMKPKEGLSLSQKVWNYTRQAKAEFEAGMSEVLEEGLKAGTSAEELGRQIRDKLRIPEMVYRRYHTKKLTAQGKKDVIEWRRKVVDSEGKVRYIKEDLEKVGQGVYRSSRKNALRLTATEINMAYRYADNERWKNEPFVIGFRIQLSGNHTLNGEPFVDMCDDLVGDYPKTFRWVGWHPRCYSSDSEVLTNRGWQLFKDVRNEDLILSLNPNTRNVEWTTIEQRMSWHHKGDMIHFHNRSLDCLVTPEHEMVYISKGTGKIQRKDAAEFRMTQGAFYRSCDYEASDIATIRIGNTELNFDLFAEFMGYWLSDGSTIRDVQIVIAQQDGDPNKDNIVSCIQRMGFRVHTNAAKAEFYSKDLCQYLKQFGKCNEKYIPQPIKNASKRQIQLFLDAFISCDGHIRETRSFIGSRGNVCESKHGERLYFTTSKQMSADLGELILKIGKRPSFHISKKAGSVSHFSNGTYTSNFDCYSISECQGSTATVFEKDVVAYDDMVYDLELTANHIMYIRRNGKCFWGSNCRCIATSILVDKEEMKKIAKLSEEEYKRYKSPNLITKMPANYDAYVEDNRDRILRAMDRGTLPYWVKDNYKDGDIDKGFYWQGRRVKTAEEKAAIQAAWDARKATRIRQVKTARNVLDVAKEYPTIDKRNLEFLLNRRKYHLLTDETKNVAKQISAINKSKISAYSDALSAIAKNVGVKVGKPMSFEEANALRGNPHFSENVIFRINCQTCVVANELRRKGLDVEAIGRIAGVQDKIKRTLGSSVWISAWTDIDGNAVKEMLVGSEVYYKTARLGKIKKKVPKHRSTVKSRKELSQLVESHVKDGERWMVAFNWEAKGTGHVICIERVEGKIRYYDPQCGKVSDVWPNLQDVYLNTGARILRVDNLLPNVDVCSKIVQKAGSKAIIGTPSNTGKILGVAEIEAKMKSYHKATSNKDRVELLKEIVEDKSFQEMKYYSTKDNKIYSADIRDFDERLQSIAEMPKNIAIAKKMVANGYNVYLLPNTRDEKSADFIFSKGGRLYYFEGKRMDGTSTLNHLIAKGVTQSDRIVVDVVGIDEMRYIRAEVKKGFERYSNLQQIILLKGKKVISITRQMANDKSFEEIFKKRWNQNK